MRQNNLVELERRAIELQNNKDYCGAITLLKQIIEENSDWEYGSPYFDLAYNYRKIGMLAEAKQNYCKALEYDPEDEIRLGGYASFLYLHGDPKEAFDAFLKLTKIEMRYKPKEIPNWNILKELGVKIGLSEEEVLKRIQA
jgi:Flp pilus assembly protein TadD